MALGAMLLGAAPARSTNIAMVNIDDRTAPVPAMHRDAKLMVALEPIAARLGIPIRHSGRIVQVRVDGTWVRLSANDTTVREGDSPLMQLSSAPQQKNGKTYVDADDVSNLLDVNASRSGNVLSVQRDKVQSDPEDFTVTEVRKVKATPSPAPTPRADAATPLPQGKRLIGQAGVTIVNQANSRYFNASFDGGGPNLHATLYASGSAGSPTSIDGTLRVGAGTRHIAVGAIADPLSGDVFAASGGNGIELESANGISAAYSNSTYNGRQSLAVGRHTDSLNEELAFVRQFGQDPQVLLGWQSWDQHAGSYFGKEVWVGLHGIAAALHYRSAGRLFTDARIGFAGAGLPLGPGDAPTQITEGYDFTKNLGIRAGFSEGHGIGAQSLVQLYGKSGIANFSISHYGLGDSLALGFTGTNAQGSLNYTVGGGTSIVGVQGQTSLSRGSLELDGYAGTLGTRDVTLDYRLNRRAPTLSFGVESVAGSGAQRIGPTVGYMAPVWGGLAAGIELHPLVRGNGFRFTLQQTILGNLRAAQRQSVFISLVNPLAAPAFLVVDGARQQLLQPGNPRIGVPLGSHYISLQSADNRFASPEERVVDGAPAAIDLPMWPVLEVSGSVRLSPEVGTLLAQRPSLGGITVVIAPQNIAVQTDEDGNFDFPAQAVEPGSTVTASAEGLPQGLAPGRAAPIGKDGKTNVLLVPSKKIEKVKF